jgi:oligopeptidase B
VWKTVIPGSNSVYCAASLPTATTSPFTERVEGSISFACAATMARRADPVQGGELHGRLSAAIRISAGGLPRQLQLDGDARDGLRLSPEDDRLETLKVQEIPSGYDPSRYATERLMLPTRDGKKVPVSIVYKKGFPKDGSGKLFLYAYGAYGYAIPPSFSSARMSLLDRAMPMPSHTSAAATISAMAGSWMASSLSAPTRSTISSMRPKG